ncbi:MAG TPA: beta-ketoacyl-ACP synthase II [bacterium]|nr:beta-ketoacyl-ACP synthase II [Candidatus Omnitrophota bacterium]HOJ60072.1 beta-ketoacyl-ACP synthase II [bacterium]HOL94866.1 beta-ketoacyl-ACP synthase II [bacterium]HPO99726.1 beta-ketoacyl-ACP synthase II [bacterium]
MSRRVVVTGMGALTPIGNTLEEFWDSAIHGRSGTGLLTRFDTTHYSSKIDAEVKGFNPEPYINAKEVGRTDLFVQYAVAAAAMSVADSGLDMETVDRNRAGVIVSSGIGGLQTIENQKEVLDQKGPRRISPYLIPMLIINMASGMVSIRYGLRGPNTSVVTACATGAHSIGEAMRLIQRGDADVMIAGGAEAAITPLGFGGFCSIRALSTRNDEPEKASRPFEKNRDGFVMGEGAGVLVLEELEHAKKRGARIYGELIGYGMSADAYHVTMPEPDGIGAQLAMRLALEDARLAVEDVDYINAHGTSTPYNDKFETLAIKSLFNSHAAKLAVSSTKSMTGHLLGAAGAVELIACLMALREGIIPPTINYETPDPECDLDYVPNQAREQRIRIAMSNSFGFGGHNAVLIAKRFE